MNEQPPQKKKFILWLSELFHKEPKNRDELVEVIRDSEQNALIDPATREMLEGVMEIAEQRVRDIMIPRSQMITLNLDQSINECLDVIADTIHSRYPVISDDKDHVEGILLAKDLLIAMHKNSGGLDLKALIRPATVVPESKRVDQMLKEFRAQRYHMAIVVDEFGGVSGLVTIEDILELIVGDIDDEYDTVEDADIRPIGNNYFTVRALTPIDDFNEYFSTHFNEDDCDTIGGFIMQNIGYLPTRGETITIDDITFKITLVDSRRIIQFQVILPDEHQKIIQK